jgi:hypothetical protein
MEHLAKPQVTKDWLVTKLSNEADRNRVIGRILSAIYKNQTFGEQVATTTKVNNGIGFCKPDARVGSIGARMYKSKGTLDKWVVDVWMKPARDGKPRICKYAEQLNSIAEEKYKALSERRVNTNFNVVQL